MIELKVGDKVRKSTYPAEYITVIAVGKYTFLGTADSDDMEWQYIKSDPWEYWTPQEYWTPPKKTVMVAPARYRNIDANDQHNWIETDIMFASAADARNYFREDSWEIVWPHGPLIEVEARGFLEGRRSVLESEEVKNLMVDVLGVLAIFRMGKWDVAAILEADLKAFNALRERKL